MRSCSLFFTPFLVSLAYIIQAQPPHLYFEKITTQNGLSHNKVNCFMQDKRGFMWIGTDDGLNRSDGRNFVVFRNEPTNPSSISGNTITKILEDKNEILWIATADGGLTKYNYRMPPSQQFKQYKHMQSDSASIPTNIINSLMFDQQGYLWLGSSGSGVLRFNTKTEQFEKIAQIGTLSILDLAIDKNGIIWVGRQGGGLLKINSRNLRYQMDPRYLDLYASLPHTTVTSLFNDGKNNMWYGSWDKMLYRHNYLTGQEELFQHNANANGFVNDEIASFAEDRNGLLWIGGRKMGLQLYDKKQNQFYNYRYDAAREGTIADDRINCIYADSHGMIWIGTNKGISINHPVQKQFEQIFLPAAARNSKGATIYDFFRNDNNDLWIGTSNGIYIYKNEAGTFQHLPLQYKGTSLTVTKFLKEKDGKFYIGTDYSLFRFDMATHQLSLLPNTEKDPVMSKLIESRVVCITRDTIGGHPVLLVSPYGHYLAYYDFTEQRWISRMDTVKKIIQQFNLKDNLIRKIYKTRSGKIWLATARLGLGDWTKDPMPKVNHLCNNPADPGTISNDNVSDIIEDNRGNLWVSTYGGGLHYFNTTIKKFIHIQGSKNLLEGIQTDKSGNIWMVSNGDLYKYDPYSQSHFSYKLPDLEKSGGISGPIYKDHKGNICVAGAGYFIRFDPASIQAGIDQTEIFFTDFKIFNTSFSHLLVKDKITLLYKQNDFRIEFAAPVFSSARNVQYAYQLQGWNKDWVETGTQNFAQFSNLDGGEYLFKVRATNNAGVWSEKVTTIRIVIIPPVWKRWWFFALCAIAITVIVYVIYRYRINELLKRQAIRNNIAQDLHDNVGSTLSSISLYSQVAKIYDQRQKQAELRDTIGKISDAAGEMISEMNDIVWAINPRHDNMTTILQRMESYAKPLLVAKNILFHFEYDSQVQHLNLEMTKRKNLYLIFKEAVNNAVKYSGCKNLYVKMHVVHRQIEMRITDDGAGFDIVKIKLHSSQSLSGNGLLNMEIRAKEMKGNLQIHSEQGNGTAILLKFPLE